MGFINARLLLQPFQTYFIPLTFRAPPTIYSSSDWPTARRRTRHSRRLARAVLRGAATAIALEAATLIYCPLDCHTQTRTHPVPILAGPAHESIATAHFRSPRWTRTGALA